MGAPDSHGVPRRRILYCEGNVDGTIGGSFYSLLFLVENLDRTRFHPIVVFHRDNLLIPRFQASGADVHVIAPSPPLCLRADRGWRWAEPLVKVLQKGANAWRHLVGGGLRCALFLRRHRVDLVHLNNSILRNHPWMLAALLTRTPCVTHERGINRFYSHEARFFARRLKAIICISGAVRASLLDSRVTHQRLVLIHNGLDASRIKPSAPDGEIRARHGISPSAPVVGIVGNIKEWKGQHVVVRACGRLRQRLPGLYCLLVGDTSAEDLAYRQELEALVREQGLQRHVIFAGYQQNPADYMNAMDVVVHASTLPEPFGRVLIEAMALGKPLVASRDGAVTEIVTEETSGLTFSPGDDLALANQVYRLLTDKTFAARIGENARHRVKEFDIRGNVKRTQELYEEILAGRSSPPAAMRTRRSGKAVND